MYCPRVVVSTLAVQPTNWEVIPSLLIRIRYSAVFGPKLGTRSMVTARFSWGYVGLQKPTLYRLIDLYEQILWYYHSKRTDRIFNAGIPYSELYCWGPDASQRIKWPSR